MKKFIYLNMLFVLTAFVSALAEKQPEPVSMERDGPRFGFNIYTGDMVKSKFTDRPDGKEYSPFTTIFGWQFEKVLISKDNNNQSIGVMFSATPLVAGLEQGLLIPAFNFMAGVRTQSGFEMAVGPSIIFNLQTDEPEQAISPSVSIALGYTISSGDFNFPTTLVLTPNLEPDLKHKQEDGTISEHSQKGLRISYVVGFNW